MKDDEAMNLQRQIAVLQGTVEQGFKGINDHLTTLNGQVLDHSKIINKIIAKDNFEDGTKQGIKVSKDFLELLKEAIEDLEEEQK